MRLIHLGHIRIFLVSLLETRVSQHHHDSNLSHFGGIAEFYSKSRTISWYPLRASC
jgi:hypothetical protein